MEHADQTPRKQTINHVVDDGPLMRMVAVNYFMHVSLEAMEAGTADEAISVLEACPDIAVIFTNIKMPGFMDGVGLATAVTRRWPITSAGRQSSPRMLLKPVVFLSKPYHLPAVAKLAEAA